LPPGSAKLLKEYETRFGKDKDIALKYLKSSVDPVSWAELMFGFDDDDPDYNLRPYQKEQLRCSGKRVVVREGRRAGKTFAMALKLVYIAFNSLLRKGRDADGKEVWVGPEIMIITPYQAQISNIFSEMEDILKRNSSLCKQVTTSKGGSLYVKTPFHRLELDNGAVISGFVSGVGQKEDGSGGGTMRGQSADWLYLDEMDMIPQEIMDAVIIPILLTRPNVGLLGTSTPIGKRERFYDWCLTRPDFKEDYYPSSVLPHWDSIKNEIENENTKEGFAAEYMAAFIDGGSGVFAPSLVYSARGAYTYDDCDLHSNWWADVAKVRERSELIKVMGIDWNKNAGSEFVVIAYSPSNSHWFVVDAVNVESTEFSGQRFIQEVERLNFKWNLDYIYADEGYGHHIIEDIKLYSHKLKFKEQKTPLEVESAKLGERLKSFNFSQKVVLKSPIDGTDIKKTGKEFLVENSVRVFEDRRIWFPEDDETLLKQLLTYSVLRRSRTSNKPVYGPENDRIGDHRLDAFMLALAGLFLESSVYSANSMPMSAPSQLTKDHLDRRANSLGRRVGALDILRGIQNEAPNVNANLLSIQRGSTEEEHDLAMEATAAKSFVEQNGGWFKESKHRKDRRRGDIGKRDNNAFEEMMRNATSSAGYSSDREDILRSSNIRSSSSVVKRRGGRRRMFKRRGGK
jgi:replicative DNA helicase